MNYTRKPQFKNLANILNAKDFHTQEVTSELKFNTDRSTNQGKGTLSVRHTNSKRPL